MCLSEHATYSKQQVLLMHVRRALSNFSSVSMPCQLLGLQCVEADREAYSFQVINISSTLGSMSTLQGSLDAPEGSFPATLSHYHLAYRSSKAALNMREPRGILLTSLS